MQPPPDPLDTLLNDWENQAPRARPMAQEVWRRIALAEEQPVRPGFWERIHTAFARPSFAAAFVVACVLLGLFLAEVRRSQIQTEYNRELMQSYLRLIDPLLEAAGNTSTPREASAKS